jgi:hypothetical protein
MSEKCRNTSGNISGCTHPSTDSRGLRRYVEASSSRWFCADNPANRDFFMNHNVVAGERGRSRPLPRSQYFAPPSSLRNTFKPNRIKFLTY